jgi:hypothetical protein
MTFGDALAVFQTRVQTNPALKPRTKEYCAYRISALLKLWPGLEAKDVSRITNAVLLPMASPSIALRVLPVVFAVSAILGSVLIPCEIPNPAADFFFSSFLLTFRMSHKKTKIASIMNSQIWRAVVKFPRSETAENSASSCIFLHHEIRSELHF